MNLYWMKGDGDVWCSFEDVSVDSIIAYGVYIIWYGGDNSHVVYVGQGDVADRITAHRMDNRILYYSQFGLYITWADVALADRDGVERYLTDSLNPLVEDVYPAAAPIEVNSPW